MSSTIPEKSDYVSDDNLKRLQDSPDLLEIVNDIESGEINELAVVAEGEEKTSWFVWTLVTCAAVSGLLFGAYTSAIRSF